MATPIRRPGATLGVAEHSNEADLVEFRTEIAPVLSDHGVDLVLMGHDHTYARTHLMDGRDPVPSDSADDLHPGANEPVYLTLNSSSGSKYYPILDDEALDAADPNGFNYVHVSWQDEAPTFTLVDVSPEALTVATYRADSGEAIDRFVLNHPAGAVQDSGASPSPSAAQSNGDHADERGQAGTADQATSTPTPAPEDAPTEPADDVPGVAIVAILAGLVGLAAVIVLLVRRKASNGGFSES